MAGTEPWGLDFFSHLDRVRDYCKLHEVDFRETDQRYIAIPAPKSDALEPLLGRFQSETFGVRAGNLLETGDAALEGELARRGADAYQNAFPNYYLCGICGFEDGSLVLLSEKISATDVIRRVRPVLQGLDVEMHLPSEEPVPHPLISA